MSYAHKNIADHARDSILVAITMLLTFNAWSIWNNHRILMEVGRQRGEALKMIREEIAAAAKDRWSGKDMRRLADEFGKLNPEAVIPEVRHEP